MRSPLELDEAAAGSQVADRASTWERATLRTGLLLLAAYQTVVGGWQYFAPRSFYDNFPTVSYDPPYNVHLVADVGGLGLSLAVIVTVAACYLDFRLVVLALAGNLTYAWTHFTFHVTHFHGAFTIDEKITVGTTLGVFAVIPVLLLLLALRIQRSTRTGNDRR